MERTEEQEKEVKNQEICWKLVKREVVHCCSVMVSHVAELLANSRNVGEWSYNDILDLCTRYDYESAAWDEGWRTVAKGDFDPDDDRTDGQNYYQEVPGDVNFSDAGSWQELCDEQNIEPYNSDVYEHWIVTRWFAEKLKEQGEIVGELFDFRIWGRGTTDQAIWLDGVIRQIAGEMEILVGQKNDWSK